MRVESIVDVFSFPVGAECEKYTYKFKDQQPWKKYQIVSNERSALITVSCRDHHHTLLPYVRILHGIHPRLDTNDTNKKWGRTTARHGIIT